MKTLKEFEREIQQAMSKEELHKISYEAFLQDTTTLDEMTKSLVNKRSSSLYNKVVRLCVLREAALNL